MLDEGNRARLVKALLLDAVDAALRIAAPNRVCIVSSDEFAAVLARRRRINLFRDSARGLNEAVADALAAASGEPAVILMPDLPFINGFGLRLWLEKVLAHQAALPPGQKAAAIAPSASGSGTNALYVSHPKGFATSFGENSLARHAAYAHQRGFCLNIAPSPHLAFDLDTPEDFMRLIRTAEKRPLKIAFHTRKWIRETAPAIVEERKEGKMRA